MSSKARAANTPTEYDYNVAGRVIAMRDHDDNETYYSCDLAGRRLPSNTPTPAR